MKKILVIVGILLLAVILSMLFSDNKRFFAQPSGCCMQRDNGSWYENGLDFRECEELNDSRDGDDVFDCSGDVWWDVDC